jgi:pimeloyl-ACP methyl ester carboxylesterase
VFAEKYRVVRYDFRGYGKSSMPKEGERFSHYEDLRALLEHLSIPNATMIGFSMGCAIALDLAIVYPEKIDALVCVGPWICGYNSPSIQEFYKGFEEITRIATSQGREEASTYCQTLKFLNPVLPNHAVQDKMKQLIEGYSFWRFIHGNHVYTLEPSACEQLHKINVPTLIVTADNDIPVCKEVAELLEKKVRNTKKVVFKDAGHLMFMEYPKVFNREVITFLDNNLPKE